MRVQMPADFSLLGKDVVMDLASKNFLPSRNIKRSWRVRHGTASATVSELLENLIIPSSKR